MPLVIPFAALLAAIIILGLAITVQVWAKAMLHVFAAGRGGGIIRIITLPLTLIARIVTPGVNFVTHELTKAGSHLMHPLAHWFDGLAEWSLANAVAVGLFAERTAIAFERVTTVVLPREIGRRVKPVEKKAAKALGLAGLTAAALRRYAHGIDRLLHRDVLPRLHRLTHAIDVTIPRELGRVRSRVGQLEHDLTHPSSTWLKRIGEALWAASLLGLLIRTLARRFPWLFCRQVKAVGNRVCGLDSGLFQSLLLDTLVIGGTISIVEFAKELQGLEGEAVTIIHGFIRDA
jgi:hypothetical protein